MMTLRQNIFGLNIQERQNVDRIKLWTAKKKLRNSLLPSEVDTIYLFITTGTGVGESFLIVTL